MEIEYDVVYDFNSLDSLIKSVNLKLKNGWKLQGGICVYRIMNYNRDYFYQAIYKEINK